MLNTFTIKERGSMGKIYKNEQLSDELIKIKHRGKIYTPDYLVKIILNQGNYVDGNINKKHVIDNSCGDGQFIVHIVDMSGTEGRNPVDDYLTIRKELGEYDPKLLKRPEIIVANKMDITGSEKNLQEFEEKLGIKAIPISAATKQNLDELLYRIADVLDEVRKNHQLEEISDSVVEYKFTPPTDDYTITKDDKGIYHVEGPAIKKLFDRTDFNNETNVRIFAQKLRKMGVDEKLRKLGVQHGDTVLILGYEFEMFE